MLQHNTLKGSMEDSKKIKTKGFVYSMGISICKWNSMYVKFYES